MCLLKINVYVLKIFEWNLINDKYLVQLFNNQTCILQTFDTILLNIEI